MKQGEGERDESLFTVQLDRALRGNILRRVFLKNLLEFWGA